MILDNGPFRLGKTNELAVLDSRGYEVVKFNHGYSELAKEFCEFLNERYVRNIATMWDEVQAIIASTASSGTKTAAIKAKFTLTRI